MAGGRLTIHVGTFQMATGAPPAAKTEVATSVGRAARFAGRQHAGVGKAGLRFAESRRLIESGFAYDAARWVYFRVRRMPKSVMRAQCSALAGP